MPPAGHSVSNNYRKAIVFGDPLKIRSTRQKQVIFCGNSRYLATENKDYFQWFRLTGENRVTFGGNDLAVKNKTPFGGSDFQRLFL
jgi:hypothetical protein